LANAMALRESIYWYRSTCWSRLNSVANQDTETVNLIAFE